MGDPVIRRPRRGLGWLLVIAMSAVGGAGCAKAELESEAPAEGERATLGASPEGVPLCPCPPGSDGVGEAAPIDETLLAFLSKARAAHHQADLAESLADRPRAIAALEQLVSGPIPGGDEPRPEAAEVLADTHARLADLRSADGAFAAALRDVEQGLSLAKQPSHFRGHLFEVRGLIEERKSRSLEEQGQAAAADEAKQSAMEAFEQAIDIQDEVIRRALDEPSPP
jgi:tetratricopeptide (TPR) repeat protein